MKKIIVLLVGCMLVNVGCVSMWTKKSWERAQKANAVRVEADGEAILMGVDLTAGAYLADNWGPAIAAGLADAAIIYGVYWGANEVMDTLDDRVGNGDGPSSVEGDAGNNDNDSNNINITINQ